MDLLAKHLLCNLSATHATKDKPGLTSYLHHATHEHLLVNQLHSTCCTCKLLLLWYICWLSYFCYLGCNTSCFGTPLWLVLFICYTFTVNLWLTLPTKLTRIQVLLGKLQNNYIANHKSISLVATCGIEGLPRNTERISEAKCNLISTIRTFV